MDIVYTIWLRSVKRYLRSKSRIVGSLGMPIFFLLVLGFGLNSVVSTSRNEPRVYRIHHSGNHFHERPFHVSVLRHTNNMGQAIRISERNISCTSDQNGDHAGTNGWRSYDFLDPGTHNTCNFVILGTEDQQHSGIRSGNCIHDIDRAFLHCVWHCHCIQNGGHAWLSAHNELCHIPDIRTFREHYFP